MPDFQPHTFDTAACRQQVQELPQLLGSSPPDMEGRLAKRSQHDGETPMKLSCPSFPFLNAKLVARPAPHCMTVHDNPSGLYGFAACLFGHSKPSYASNSYTALNRALLPKSP